MDSEDEVKNSLKPSLKRKKKQSKKPSTKKKNNKSKEQKIQSQSEEEDKKIKVKNQQLSQLVQVNNDDKNEEKYHQSQDECNNSEFQMIEKSPHISESQPQKSIFAQDSIYSSYLNYQNDESQSKYIEPASDWKNISDSSEIDPSQLEELSSHLQNSQFHSFSTKKSIQEMGKKKYLQQLKKLPDKQPYSKEQKPIFSNNLILSYNINLGVLYFHEILEQFAHIILDLRKDTQLFAAIQGQLKSQITVITNYIVKYSQGSHPGSDSAKIRLKIKQIQYIDVLIKQSKKFKSSKKIELKEVNILTPADHRYYAYFLFKLSQIVIAMKKKKNLRSLSRKYQRKYLDVKFVQPIYLSKQMTDFMRYLYQLSDDDYEKYRKWSKTIINDYELKIQQKNMNKLQKKQQNLENKQKQQILPQNEKVPILHKKSQIQQIKGQQQQDHNYQRLLKEEQSIEEKKREENNQNGRVEYSTLIKSTETENNQVAPKQNKHQQLQQKQISQERKILIEKKSSKVQTKKKKSKVALNPLEKALVMIPKYQVKQKRNQNQWVTHRFKGRDPKYLASYRYSEQYLAAHPEQRQKIAPQKKQEKDDLASNSDQSEKIDIKPNHEISSEQELYKSENDEDSLNSDLFLEKQRKSLMEYVISQSLQKGTVQFKRTMPRHVNHYGVLEQSRNFQHSKIKNQLLKEKKMRETALAKEKKRQMYRANLLKLDEDYSNSKKRKKVKLQTNKKVKREQNFGGTQTQRDYKINKQKQNGKIFDLDQQNQMHSVDQSLLCLENQQDSQQKLQSIANKTRNKNKVKGQHIKQRTPKKSKQFGQNLRYDKSYLDLDNDKSQSPYNDFLKQPAFNIAPNFINPYCNEQPVLNRAYDSLGSYFDNPSEEGLYDLIQDNMHQKKVGSNQVNKKTLENKLNYYRKYLQKNKSDKQIDSDKQSKQIGQKKFSEEFDQNM